MLRYFRINDPYRLVGVLVIAILLFLPVLISTPLVTYPELKSFVIGERIHDGFLPYAGLIDSTAPLTSWFYGLIDMVAARSLFARHIIAFFIIYFQSAYLAMVFINRKVFSDSTYLPALLFIVLITFSYDTIALTGELIGAGFLLLAINNLCKELEFRGQRDETVLGLGLYISFASLCVFAYSIFLIAAACIIVFYSRRDLRILLLLIIGFLLPHLLLISTYFLLGYSERLVNFYYLSNLSFSSAQYVSVKTLLLLGSIPLVFLLFALIVVNRETRLTKYQSQVLQSMFIMMVFSLVFALFTNDLRPQSVIIMIPPLSFFLTHFFLSLHRKRFAEFSFWVLLLGIAGVSFLGHQGTIDGITYDNLKVEQADKSEIKGKRMLVLSDDLSYYMNNKLATPFFNWSLSKQIFTNPDYFDNVIWVNKALKTDPPDYIVDPDYYMDKYFDRIPQAKEDYLHVEEGRYTRR